MEQSDWLMLLAFWLPQSCKIRGSTGLLSSVAIDFKRQKILGFFIFSHLLNFGNNFRFFIFSNKVLKLFSSLKLLSSPPQLGSALIQHLKGGLEIVNTVHVHGSYINKQTPLKQANTKTGTSQRVTHAEVHYLNKIRQTAIIKKETTNLPLQNEFSQERSHKLST